MRPVILGLLAALALAGCDGNVGGSDAPDAPAAPAADAALATRRPFASPTSGGARLSSAHYRLDLFVAPASPSGSTASDDHRLRLGPAAASRP